MLCYLLIAKRVLGHFGLNSEKKCLKRKLKNKIIVSKNLSRKIINDIISKNVRMIINDKQKIK